jgi:hypothetical protein
MAERRRAPAEFEATQSNAGPQVVTLDSLVGGYNGYTSPDLLSPQFWAGSSNVYAGQFGTIRRARWAPIANSAGIGVTGTLIRTMTSLYGPNFDHPYILFDNGVGPNPPFYLFQYDTGLVTAFIFSIGTFPYYPAVGAWLGPYMRLYLNPALLLQANGQTRSKFLIMTGPTSFTLEYWGIDAPNTAVQVTLSAGTTGNIVAATGAARLSNIVTITATAALPANVVPGNYVNIAGVTDTTFDSAAGTAYQILSVAGLTFTYAQIGPNATSGGGTFSVEITKTIGRSYQWAWENVNSTQKSAPSPASQFVLYTNQTGLIDCIQPGTVAFTAGSAGVVGTNTQFNQSMVGKWLWANGYTFAGGLGLTNQIISVTDATHLTINTAAINNGAALAFQVYDEQSTNVDLYATGDGQPVYFLIARNTFTPFTIAHVCTTLALSGLEFTDTANSEPPNPPFSSEITQIYNVPPPIGTYLQDYQGRALVFGVPANLQTFFYSNIEATVVGQPLESFSPLNTVTLPIGDGQINGMANLPTGLIIWSNRQGMFKLTGLLSDNTIANSTQLGATIQRLPYAIGAASPYATAVTPLGAIWLSSDREVWLFTDHYAPKNVGKPIQDVLNRINGARLGFARMKYYKRGDRSWLALALALDSSTFNNKLVLLDLDLLASNGQPSYFTFDMATNAPTWYQFDTTCESIEQALDQNNINHLVAGAVDLMTDLDWQPTYYTVTGEQSVSGSNLLHAIGNEDPHMIKTFEWMRAMTNQIPKNLAAQGWAWSVNAFDDDAYVIGVNPLTTNLIPGVDSNSNPLFLEYSPAKFKFGGVRPVKGRRFQIGTTFPSAPGLFELRGFEVAYSNIVGR